MLQSLAQVLLLGVVAAHETTTSQSGHAIPPRNHYRDGFGRRQAIDNTTVTSVEPTGLMLAKQCAQTLASWASASTDWSYAHSSYHVTTETYKQPAWATEVIPSYKASSLTTLCDGHPRVVGFAGSTSLSTILGTSGQFTMSAYNVTQYVYNTPPYPTPQAPCTISNDDCQALYEKNSSLVYASYQPICNISSTSSTTLTYATDSAGHTCSMCYLRASSARLLYWPVRTVNGSGDICASSVQTLGLPRTGDGPNTFVTDGVTITSPSVGIYLASVSRQDQCYTTVASTVVVVPASEVLSARGARALYDHEPFQYQDLNYKCQPANSSEYWIQDEPGNDCYQQVPAVAYFSGESAFGWDEYYPTAFGPPLTIGPEYRPYILPPATMTDWANSIFSTSGCQIQVDGVWDPPRALLPGSTVLTPVVAWETATSAIIASTSPAWPAEVEHSQPEQTSATQIVSTTTAVADHLSGTQASNSVSSDLTTIVLTSEIKTAMPAVTETQSMKAETTDLGSSSPIPGSAADATPQKLSSHPSLTISTTTSKYQSSLIDSASSDASASDESTPPSVVVPATSTQVSQSLDSPSHITGLSSMQTSDLATRSFSSSRPVTSSPLAFQGQAAGPKISFSLGMLLMMIVFWLR